MKIIQKRAFMLAMLLGMTIILGLGLLVQASDCGPWGAWSSYGSCCKPGRCGSMPGTLYLKQHRFKECKVNGYPVTLTQYRDKLVGCCDEIDDYC